MRSARRSVSPSISRPWAKKGDEMKDTVTLRHRDSMKQERVAIKDLPGIDPAADYLLVSQQIVKKSQGLKP